jgi:hypothetical protein
VLRRPGVDVLDPELDGVKALWLPLSKSESPFSSQNCGTKGTGLPAILTGTRTGLFLSTVLSRLGNPSELELLDDADADVDADA